RDDEVLGRRQEHARRILQQLLRSDAEDDVLELRVVDLRDENLEVGIKRRAVERIAVGLGEFSEDRIDRVLTGTERVFVAADADGLHPRGEIRPHTSATVSALLQFGHEIFMSAGRQPLASVVNVPRSQTLKETAARHRHELLLQLPNQYENNSV